MPTTQEMIASIEEEIKKTKYNKATQQHIGLLKAKLARLRDEEIARASKKVKGAGFSFKKVGDATVVIIGFPSVGKSTLINALTNANSKIGHYDFTTLDAIPGMMNYNDANIQLIDLPGIVVGASKSRGSGRKVLSVAQNADLIIILSDPFDLHKIELIKNELYEFGVRLNQIPPDVSIKKRSYGGIRVSYTFKYPKLDENTIISILREYRILNADIIIRENIKDDQFIDVLEANRIYVPLITVINKIDLLPSIDVSKDYIPISAEKKEGIVELQQAIYTSLQFIKVYMKPHGEKVDYEEPLVLKEGSTLRDVCKTLHKDFVRKFRYGEIRKTEDAPRKKVGLEYKIEDKDIITIIRKR